VKKLTVVIVPLRGVKAMHRCLSALDNQTLVQGIEVLIPHDDTLEGVGRIRNEFPNFTFLRSPGAHTYASLRSLGVRAARGDIIAITEDHCIPGADWAAQIVRAHSAEPAAIGGAVEKHAPDSPLNWALYLIDYLRYSAPKEGPSTSLTDCNVSYKRRALQSISDIWIEEFHEPEVNGALIARGWTLWISPSITLDQQRTIGLREAFEDRYRFGRLFGARRALTLSARHRFLVLAFAPFLPMLLSFRTIRDSLKRKDYALAFCRSVWLIILLNTVWAWGEFMGSLTRRADASLTHTPKQATSEPS
jgi:hypothetical protein